MTRTLRNRAAVAAIALAAVSLPALPQPYQVINKPSDNPRLGESSESQEKIVHEISSYPVFPADAEMSFFWIPRRVSRVRFEPKTLVFEHPERPLEVLHESLKDIEVITKRRGGVDWYGAKITPDLVLWYEWYHHPKKKPDFKERAILFAHALYALYWHNVEQPREEARFDDEAARYRAASPKPALPEEVRRYKVQAELMIKTKQFAQAAQLYAAALQVAPWWSEGRYNRALVLSELQRYPEGVAEMKRFLKLEPDSADARVVQDKIYEWEALTKQNK